MKKQTAQLLVGELTKLLTGRTLVSVSVIPIGIGLEVRLNQEFHKAYFVEHKNGDCVVALCDSYGVMTGAETWVIDPDKRTVHAKSNNSFGEKLHYAWTISDNDDSGEIWQTMKILQQKLWTSEASQ